MPIQLILAPEPEEDVSPGDAAPYLVEFTRWLINFFADVNENQNERDEVQNELLFQPEQISFLNDALEEMRADGHFNDLIYGVENISVASVREHGLYGSQLRWKLNNINFSFRAFTNRKTAALFERLLWSIDALLDSILQAVPGGSAVKELKEAIRNSLSIAID